MSYAMNLLLCFWCGWNEHLSVCTKEDLWGPAHGSCYYWSWEMHQNKRNTFTNISSANPLVILPSLSHKQIHYTNSLKTTIAKRESSCKSLWIKQTVDSQLVKKFLQQSWLQPSCTHDTDVHTHTREKNYRYWELNPKPKLSKIRMCIHEKKFTTTGKNLPLLGIFLPLLLSQW